MDLGFIGLLLAHRRERPGAGMSHGSTAAMTLLLCLHLGAVMALFLTLPYGKFAHAVLSRCRAPEVVDRAAPAEQAAARR